jgi:hypothetical protein
MRWALPAFLIALSLPAVAQPQPRAATPLIENEAAYLARCRRETIAQYPNARAQADSICTSKWTQIVAAGPLAEAILAAAPATGTRFDPVSLRAKLTSVRWAARAQPGAVLSGKMGDIDVGVTGTPQPGISFHWFRDGDTIPFDLPEALRVRGAVLAMIACQSFGSSEGTRIYRVTLPAKSPFALTIAAREAEVASQSSTFAALTDFGGQMPTLATLRKDGGEWAPVCPQ